MVWGVSAGEGENAVLEQWYQESKPYLLTVAHCLPTGLFDQTLNLNGFGQESNAEAGTKN